MFVARLEKEIMLVVGEASGDAHGAQLVEALHRRAPGLKVYGVAGAQLQRTRFEALFSVAQLTGMGLVEVERSSGLALYDRSALRAVHSMGRLPPLPTGFQESYLGVHFEFIP